ncbi:MAG: class I SAM-dependent methyltransferase [Polaribacter sp.]|nr:class I SAM-dependent methyltransferase [Polaribacter sp.]
MNLAILHKNIQEFISNNLKTDLTTLILKGSPFDTVSIQELATQIVSKKKSSKKLPTWFSTKNIYYPPTLNIEQSSSEITAEYKSSLISGTSLIDITGGFGIDAHAFSKQIQEVTHCEINSDLSSIVAHNYKQLGVKNICTVSGDGIAYLKSTAKNFGCIYIDPSRRNEAKGKVFLLKDCLPNVPENLDFLFSKSTSILIKNSPILDITSAINELIFVKEIHIIAVHNEVKELLFLLEKDHIKNIQIKTINVQKDTRQEFQFTINKEAVSTYSKPLSYLYEPNAAILKSGGFHQISQQLTVFKLHQHSHLYTSTKHIEFPGRVFKIKQVMPYDKKQLKKLLKDGKANITTRNFPETVAQIRKKTALKDGGHHYLFFTTDLNNKPVVIISTQIFR